jgi:hypothetical protein
VPQLGNAVRDLSRLILRHEVRRRQPEFDYGNKQIKAAPNGKALLFNASWPRSLPPRFLFVGVSVASCCRNGPPAGDPKRPFSMVFLVITYSRVYRKIGELPL